MDKLARFVKDELARISFFLINADEIEKNFTNKLKKFILSMPVKWDSDSLLVHGVKPSETKDSDYFYSDSYFRTLPRDISVRGVISGHAFTFKVEYGDKRHYYYLDFENKDVYDSKKGIPSMPKVKEIFTKIESGEGFEEKDYEKMYNALFKKKANKDEFKNKLINKFFGDYSNLSWIIEPKLDRQKGNVPVLRLYATGADSDQIKQLFKIMDESDIKQRVPQLTPLMKNVIPNFVGNYIQDAGFESDPKIKGIIKPKIQEDGGLEGKIGFTIWLE